MQLNCSCDSSTCAGSALGSLDFALCELRKALISKVLIRADKTPKAEVAGVPFLVRSHYDEEAGCTG